MKFSALLIINGLIAIVFGVAFVFIPWQVYSFYGVEPNPQLNYMGQLFGTALVTIALVAWLFRNATEPGVRKPIVSALLIGNTIGFIASLIGQLNGVVNALGWSTVAIYLILALGFAYFQFSKQSPS